MDTFKGENWERLDDFMYQVEEFAAFHAWDQVETCRQARTHLRGVSLQPSTLGTRWRPAGRPESILGEWHWHTYAVHPCLRGLGKN